jgi:hypothetical protein
MTAYVCVRCRKTWEIKNGDTDPTISGGLCKRCLKNSLIQLYRGKQSKEGNFDCFGKAIDSCDQLDCRYRELCLDSSVDD